MFGSYLTPVNEAGKLCCAGLDVDCFGERRKAETLARAQVGAFLRCPVEVPVAHCG